ncbi:hypothetical protein NPIL_472951 [Nephila pilipes]|uniref:Uncharacterized protein n=1 Tax=Nephila pilipes TaxID=299642 RepID=A0A8X6UUK9_NEPPI|nr:hypothetical protein NPIL_472951 [Nephila pilipes]
MRWNGRKQSNAEADLGISVVKATAASWSRWFPGETMEEVLDRKEEQVPGSETGEELEQAWAGAVELDNANRQRTRQLFGWQLLLEQAVLSSGKRV